MGRYICITDSHLGEILPSGDIWRFLESVVVVTAGGCYCQWVGIRGAGRSTAGRKVPQQSRRVQGGRSTQPGCCVCTRECTDRLLTVSVHARAHWPILAVSLFQFFSVMTAAAAKSLQSCPTLCDPIDGSPPGSPGPGILQARTREWVARWLVLL